MKRNRILSVVLITVCVVCCGFVAKVWLFGHRRPNVLLVTFDTTRSDRIGCYGYADASTPAIDALAAQGVLFERAYAPAPLTLPSHCTIMTGLYPPEHGIHANGQAGLDSSVPTLASRLLSQGYRTGAFISSFVLGSKFGLNSGFETYNENLKGGELDLDDSLHYRSGNFAVDAALDWLKKGDAKPFLCWVHFYDPHDPYLDHGDLFGDKYKQRPYDAEIAFADLQLQRLLNYLKEHGLEKQTLVVVAGDHGEGLGDHHERTHANMLYDSTMHVPLVFSGAGVSSAGKRVAVPVSLVDLFPSILDTLGLPAPDNISGRTLKPALQDGSVESRAAYGETEQPWGEARWSPLWSLTTEKWKYIRTPRTELYDLESDPHETNNLAQANANQVATLDRQLSDLQSQMIKRQAIVLHLSEAEQRALSSLGYASGSFTQDGNATEKALPDIKDRIKYLDEFAAALDLMHAKSFEQAILMLESVVKSVPDYAKAQLNLGVCLAKIGKYDEAAAHFEAGLRTDPQGDRFHGALGMVRLSQGRLSEAIPYFMEALKRDPHSAHSHHLLAESLLKIGHFSTARKHYEAELSINPNSEDGRAGLQAAIIQEQALTDRTAALRIEIQQHPRDATAHYNLAGILVQQDQIEEAISHYSKSLDLKPDDIHVLMKLAFLLATTEQGHLRNGPRAVQLAERACELTKEKDTAPLDTLAAAYAESGQFKEAVATAKKAIERAQADGKPERVNAIRRRLQDYESKRPYRVGF